MSKTFKYILIGLSSILGLFIIGIIIFYLMIASAFGAFDKDYSVSDLKEEYFSKEKEIDDLILYFNEIKPKDKSIAIEFKDDKTLSRLRINYKDSTRAIFQQWDIPVKNLLNPELSNHLIWNDEKIKRLKIKLDKADCISIEDGEPIKIGFKRSGMGMYSFIVFQDKITDRNNFNDSCQYILVSRKLVLEYGGGAIGPQCFQNFE